LKATTKSMKTGDGNHEFNKYGDRNHEFNKYGDRNHEIHERESREIWRFIT